MTTRKDTTTELDQTQTDEVKPLAGDELLDAVTNKLNSVNPNFSSYDAGRHEELTWVHNLIAPPPPEEVSPDDESTAEDPFLTS